MSAYRASDFFASQWSPQDQPLVSIITPVYNGEEYLPECIESVLAQTYQNWNYTIVNNCSKDRTLEIARAYAAKDDRIRVIDCQEFLPIIPNHNRAIRQISPDSVYCKVIMADDWIFPECLMKMVTLAETYPSVGLVGAYGLHGDGVHVIWHGVPFPRTVMTGREVSRMRLLSGRYVFGAPTATLIRSSFIRKMDKFYDEDNLHADSTACFRILQDADFGFVHQVLTFTRTQPGSNTSFSDRMNSLHLCFLSELIQYGPACLAEDELKHRLEVRLREYYRVLAEAILQRRGEEYLEFHKKWLANLGIPLSRTRLMRGFLAAAWAGVSHPQAAITSLGRWWSKASAVAPAKPAKGSS